MRDMANKLGLSVSYLSAIENAKRNVPNGFEEKINEAYDLSKEQKQTLHEDIELSTDQMKVKVSNLDDRKKKVLFALTNDDLDDDTLNKLVKAIEEGRIKQ